MSSLAPPNSTHQLLAVFCQATDTGGASAIVLLLFLLLFLLLLCLLLLPHFHSLPDVYSCTNPSNMGLM